LVSFRTCPDCLRFKAEEFPKHHATKGDTRVIEVARADKNWVCKASGLGATKPMACDPVT